MEQRRVKVILAVILILIGVCSILKQVFHVDLLGHFSIGSLLLLALGLYFEWSFFNDRRSPGILIPGGILTIIGLGSFLEELIGGNFWYDFPYGTIGVIVGLFQFYYFGKRNNWLLIPIGLLLLSALDDIGISIAVWFNSSIIWPVALIVLGIYLIADMKNGKL